MIYITSQVERSVSSFASQVLAIFYAFKFCNAFFCVENSFNQAFILLRNAHSHSSISNTGNKKVIVLTSEPIASRSLRMIMVTHCFY